MMPSRPLKVWTAGVGCLSRGRPDALGPMVEDRLGKRLSDRVRPATPRCVILPRRSLLRSVMSMLCIGLALVFVGTSAARVVNLSQHDLRMAHAHDHHDALTMIAAMHDGVDPGAGVEDETGSQDGDVEPGDNLGNHQHADGPVGFYAADFDIAVDLTFNGQNLGGEPDRSPHGWPPKGPERPPRSLTTRA